MVRNGSLMFSLHIEEFEFSFSVLHIYYNRNSYIPQKLYLMTPFKDEQLLNCNTNSEDLNTVLNIIRNHIIHTWIPHYKKAYERKLLEIDTKTKLSLRSTCLKKIVEKRCDGVRTDYSTVPDHIKEEIGHLWYTRVKKGDKEFLKKIA